jgi:hypothetical protein
MVGNQNVNSIIERNEYQTLSKLHSDINKKKGAWKNPSKHNIKRALGIRSQQWPGKKNREQREREGQTCVEIGMCNNWPEQTPSRGQKGIAKGD